MWYITAVLLLCVFAIFVTDINFISMMIIRMIILTKFVSNVHSYFLFSHSYFICVDTVSCLLCMLTLWISMLMVLAMKDCEDEERFISLCGFLNFVLIYAFFTRNFLIFYMLFEFSLIPTLLIILGWGVQPERIKAGRYLIIYTTIGSIPLLLSIIHAKLTWNSLKICMLLPNHLILNYPLNHRWLRIFWVMAFVIKLPIYGVHLWLPKAHVEAPVAGSMILAGVLLKLGAYGMIRISYFNYLYLIKWANYAFYWVLVSIVIVGLICFRQCDLKSLVAYSSVAHMSLVMAGLFSLDIIGAKGVVGMLIAHGLSSSGLFYGVQCLYTMTGSRNIMLNRGIINISPTFCFFWFLLCVCNASIPPSLNFMSEFFLMTSIINYGGPFAAFFLFVSIFLSGLFRIHLYSSVCHGKLNPLHYSWRGITFYQSLVLFLHVFPLFFLVPLMNHLFI